MSIRKHLIRLAHENPEFRPHLVPLLRYASENLFRIGEKLHLRGSVHGTGFQPNEQVVVVGYEPDQFTPMGPQPFITFYWVESVANPGHKKLLSPDRLGHKIGKLRDEYLYAFSQLEKAVKKSGLSTFKRESSAIRGQLGFENKGPNLPPGEIQAALLRMPYIKQGPGNSLLLTIPTGQTQTRDYPIRVSQVMHDRIDLLNR